MIACATVDAILAVGAAVLLACFGIAVLIAVWGLR
jgi:hypothetical protein